jgi:hypothetical protein
MNESLGLKWLRIRARGGFYEMLENSGVAEWLAASQEGPSSVEFVLFGHCTGRILINLTCSRLRAWPQLEHCRPRSAREFCRWFSISITCGIKGSSYHCSQIVGGVENAVPLYVDISRTGGRCSEINVLLQFVFRSRFTAVNFVLKTTP